MENHFKEIASSIKAKQAILFVGAGVSATLGLFTFHSLLDEVAKQLGYEPDIFREYAEPRTLAEFYLIKKGTLGELRSYLDKKWHDESKIDIANSEIHKLIVNLDFPIIYTTNWDYWIEKAYEYHGKSYHKIAGVTDLAKEESGATKIIKFHGDFTDDESIVFTESKYLERLSLDTPLDIRLKSDLIGKTVLFIGYSLQDPNIRFVLHWANKMWSNVEPREARPKSFVFFDKPNPIEECVLKEWGVYSLVSQFDDPAKGLIDFLSKLNSELKA